MSSNLCALERRIRVGAALVALSLLSACGGGGTSVASIPPPPPPPAPPPPLGVTSVEVDRSWLNSPVTRTGSYDVIALLGETRNGASSFHFAGANEFGLQVSKSSQFPAFSYALSGPSGSLPGGVGKASLPVPVQSWDFNPGGPNYRYDNPYGNDQQYFGENLKEYDVYEDGTKKLREDYDYDRAAFKGPGELPDGQLINQTLVFDASLSYVAMGEWSWGPVTVGSDGTTTPTGDSNSIYFVFGDRTPSSGIPASGTASYDAHTLGGVSTSGIPFSLTADFGQRLISTEISQANLFDVKGSAAFGNDGSFGIPLSGSAGSNNATGMMDGAFFGPHAEQVGGVVSVSGSQGPLLQDAFVGEHH